MAAAGAEAPRGEAGAQCHRPPGPLPRPKPSRTVMWAGRLRADTPSAVPSRPATDPGHGGSVRAWVRVPRARVLGGMCARAASFKAWCVPCLVSLDTLQELCRKEKLTCKSIGITKRNLNNYEVEYLCDYKVVKVITSEEAEKRGQLYDNQGITYLFDLDYESDEFTVDAARYGNVSHFVNHSCDPNLQVFSVFIDNLDTRLPRIALFSTRTIKAGEELTFDYQMKGSGELSSDSDHSPAKKRVRTECKCGAETCRGYLN
ncbi:histone-lysine N-methyltransferase SUV39H2 isoform X6 [Alexandromys fortis]|uniref:histone-lysine N-methyltransferase SUV39H2 isoform X6 n=1 Tax=Alexandromys fortis TaxID=100897 RepID=UPI0021521B65|nr:histone-lysine N-methyltransferase SUV39H2 isoform X6 [Microtus fortis]